MRTAHLATIAVMGVSVASGIVIYAKWKMHRTEQTISCMLETLMDTPGVTHPILRHEEGTGAGPTLEFETADYANWTGSPKCGQSTQNLKHFCFQTRFVATMTGKRNVEDAVINRFMQHCGVRAEITSFAID